MKLIALFFTIFILSACQTMHSTDPSSLFFTIPDGSTLTLNKELAISKSDTHALIQAGKPINEQVRNDYEINCRLDMKKFGPRTIKPETFRISRTEDGTNWISQPSILRFYTEVYLQSDKETDVIKLECQQYGGRIDRNFTVTEMQQALGDYFSFNFAATNKNEQEKK